MIGTVHLLQSRTDEAIVLLEKARSDISAAPIIRAHLAAAYGVNGEIGRAGAELAEARRLAGGNPYSSIASMKRGGWGSVSPKTRTLFEATYFAGLRKAGVPEE